MYILSTLYFIYLSHHHWEVSPIFQTLWIWDSNNFTQNNSYISLKILNPGIFLIESILYVYFLFHAIIFAQKYVRSKKYFSIHEKDLYVDIVLIYKIASNFLWLSCLYYHRIWKLQRKRKSSRKKKIKYDLSLIFKCGT